MFKIKRFSKITEEQREYTRAEKQAFKELYRVTKGLRVLPKASSARDVQRFNQLAVDLRKLSLGNVSGFDRENARRLLVNSNMPISASQVDRIIDKYSNKRALVRLSRLKNRKGTNVDVEAIRKPFTIGSKVMDRGADVYDSSQAAFNKIHESHQPNLEMMNKLTNYAQQRGIKVERLSDHPDFRGKFDSFVETMPDMSRRVDGRYLGKIVQNTSALEGDLAHEIGHIRTFLSGSGQEIKKFRGAPEYSQLIQRTSRGKALLDDKNYAFQRAADRIVGIANENSASAYGNSLLKKLGSSPSRFKVNTENQTHALRQYLGESINHIGHDFRESLRWT